MRRARALFAKEMIELRRTPSLVAPAVLVAALVTVLPVFVAVVVPSVTGESLAASNDLEVMLDAYRSQPRVRGLDAEAAAQALIFQQFLLLLVLAPITSAVSVAAQAVVGEKQARTLEPLLATPISTWELLGAKIAGALVPAVGVTVASLACYAASIAGLARPGVLAAVLSGAPLAFVLVLGPLAAMAAVEIAVCASAAVRDARTAQQVGALVILPAAGLFVAQALGALTPTPRLLAGLAAGLVAVDASLLALAVRTFRRESILTRWR